MMFISQAFQFVIVVAAAFNAVTSAHSTDELAADTNAAATVQLGRIATNLDDYVILAMAGISTVPDTSDITGNIGVSPIAATAITGFGLIADSTNIYSTSARLTGQAFAADYTVPTPEYLTTAVGDMLLAYTDAAGRPCDDDKKLNYGFGILGGVFGGSVNNVDHFLAPGVYKYTTDVTIGGDITFDGDSNDIFIIQIAGKLEQVGDTQIKLVNGALAENIFWQVAGSVLVNDRATMEGILLVGTSVLFKTGSSINGRILSQTHVALQSTTVN
jgi:hypothetical protein